MQGGGNHVLDYNRMLGMDHAMIAELNTRRSHIRKCGSLPKLAEFSDLLCSRLVTRVAQCALRGEGRIASVVGVSRRGD